MKLSDLLYSEFDDTVRTRGMKYYRQGLVRIHYGSETEVEATVRGSLTYDVDLVLEHDGKLILWCDCPYFDDAPCKHLWATILAADERGYLGAAKVNGNLSAIDGSFGLVPPKSPHVAAPKPKPSQWRKQLSGIVAQQTPASSVRPWPAKREVVYLIDAPASQAQARVILNLYYREAGKKGGWNMPKELRMERRAIAQLPDARDRSVLTMLAGSQQYWGYSSDGFEQIPNHCQLAPPLASLALPLMVEAERCFLKTNYLGGDLIPLVWDDGPAWKFGLEIGQPGQGQWSLKGILRRGGDRIDLSETAIVTKGGFVFANGRVARLDNDTSFEWLSQLRSIGPIEVPEKEGDELLRLLLESPHAPPVEVPEPLRYEETPCTPRPSIRITARKSEQWRNETHLVEVSFDYAGRLVRDFDSSSGFFDSETRRYLRRDAEFESASAARLLELGLKRQSPPYGNGHPTWELAVKKLPQVVYALIKDGWSVEAEGKVFRRPGQFRIEVSSGVDWFELHGEVDYGDSTAKLPELLEALKRGENMVKLGDGSFGVLPEEWLARFAQLAGLGAHERDHVRFRRNQAGLLDALLAAQPEVRCDETFARVREELRRFEGVRPAGQPDGFQGHLRDYQREGLGWMHFLRDFGFGGCLADDMGVGKTAQVLALLETRRELRASGRANGHTPAGPSLVVVPKSLVFNWKEEAAKFTPKLRVLDYTGMDRYGDNLDGYDVVLTTYGTLRRDAVRLKDVSFDYVVLDEAQAVKNAATESAKAARLLRGSYRLALSGTPVENHLGELWSLFEFLNPGMLGGASVFKLAGGALRNPGEETRHLLAHALRPFILRRTKEQVARELPPKTEQSIYCEMEPAQRKSYNELRRHYRETLLGRIDDEGLAKSKMHVLEALLRLRQAACHPGLLDAKRAGESSAKMDTLFEHLTGILQEGHKALVFSQFTSLLKIVRDRLDADGVTYEYLDGATRDRQARVERFQNDPACPLFLISLKAGGLGLNLTAAGYVFLLDPWWNPAVEAQAVDRAHRIGQTEHVFAYRLITRDTVEEKVLELQQSKRDLASAIINADNTLLRDLRREDLELLLS